MRIAVLGVGYVGAVTSACLAKSGHQVTAYDIDHAKVAAIQNGKSPIAEKDLGALIAKHVEDGNLTATDDLHMVISQTDISLICVGTPSNADGSLDLQYVEDVCREIGESLKQVSHFHTVVLRSTMLPNSAEKICIPLLEKHSGKTAGVDFGVGNNPEFLREGSAIADYFSPPKIVVGAVDVKSGEIIMSLYDGLDAPRIQTDLKTAEGVKYADNAWHALKIGFANELGNVLSECGVDSHKVMDIFCQDKKLNISTAYLKPGFAFGGSCLPKDVRAIRALGKKIGQTTPLFDSLLSANDNQIERAVKFIKDGAYKHITLLGLSFKADTDDTRESPLLKLAEKLIGFDYTVNIYDPVVAQHESYRSDIINDTHFIDTLPDQTDLIIIGNNNAAHLDLIKAQPDAAILDLVRLNNDLETRKGYRGICW